MRTHAPEPRVATRPPPPRSGTELGMDRDDRKEIGWWDGWCLKFMAHCQRLWGEQGQAMSLCGFGNWLVPRCCDHCPPLLMTAYTAAMSLCVYVCVQRGVQWKPCRAARPSTHQSSAVATQPRPARRNTTTPAGRACSSTRGQRNDSVQLEDIVAPCTQSSMPVHLRPDETSKRESLVRVSAKAVPPPR